MSSEPSKLGNTARLLFAACVGACLNEAIQLASHQPRLSLLWLTLLGAFAWRQWSGSSLQKEQEPEQEQERASAGGQRQPVKAAVQELRRLFWSLKGVTQQRLWAALVALIIAGHSGCMIYKGSYCLFALLMEVGIVGCSMYLLGQQKSAETMKAIANEAAVRLVALHRQNEGLADEKEELEAELKSIAQQKQSALHAGSPADLILEVLDLMLEGGVPRADDLLLLRDFILSGSHHHDMYQPLDVWQQLHTLTMEPDVEEALCYQLLGRAPSKEVSPAFYSMPENNGLSSDALLDPKNNPLRSCFSDQLPPSFLSEAHSGQEGTGQEGLSAEDGLRNMLAAIACDNSILEVRRSPNHIASNSSLLQKLSVRGGNSSFTEQAQMVLGPEKLPSQKSSISSHLDRLQTIGRVGSDGSAASNKSCPPQLVGSLNGGASSGINREGSNNWSSFGTAGVLGFPTAAAAAATAQRRGSGEHSDLPVSPTLPLHRRRDKLRTLSALMQAPGGTGPPLRNPRARSSCSLGLGLQQAQEQQQQQQASAHISGGSQPPSTVHSPSNSPFPSSSYCRRPPRPSHSMSNLNSKQQVERKPAQQHPSVEMADTETANKEAVGPNFPTLLSRKSKTQPDLMGSSQLLPRQQPSPRPPDFSKLSHTTAESSSTFQSRSQKAWSTHTSHSDCLLPSFPLNASSSEVAARRGSLPFLHPHGMPRHPAGSSGSLSRRLSQLSMCQPLSGLLSEGRRASQQSMYHPSSGALSDSRKVLSEEAVCKDLMLAAQCSERHVLDEVEEAAAEQLYAGSSRSTLPGHQAPSPEQIGAGFEQGADHLMVVGPRSGSSSVVSGPPRPPSLHISSPFSDQALAAPKPPDTAPTPPRASMEAPAFPLPTGSFLCGQEQEQLQLMLQSRQPSSRLPSKSSSRSMPTLADLLCRKKPAPNRGLRGREEEEEEKEEEEEEEVEQEEQQLGLGNLVQVPPCANSARASRVAAAELKHTPTADQASSFISNSKQKSESSCSSKGEDVKLDVRGSASQPRRGSQCTDTESVVSAPGSRRSGTSSSARQWVLGLLEGGSNSRRRPRAAQTFSEKSPSLEPMVSPSSKPASKAKKGPLQQLFGNMKGRGKSLKNKDAEKCPANSTAAKEGSERSTPAAPSSTASEASHVGSLQDARKGILGSQGSAPAESLDAIAASVIGLGTLDAPSASTHAARIHDAGGAVGGGSLPAGPFAAASAQAVAPVGPPPTAPADAAPAAPTPTAPAAAAAVAAAEPQGCEPQVCVPQSECAEAPIPPPAACSSRGSPSSGHGSVVISGNIGSSGRVGTKRVQGPLSLTELAVEVNAATDETRASPSSTAAAAAAGASKVPASSSSRGEPGWLDNDQQQSTTVEMNEDSEILRQKELMQPGLAPGRRGGAVRARGSSVLSFEGSSRHSSTFPLEPVSSSTSLFTGSALPSKTLQSGVQTLQSDHALAPKPSNYVTASARGPPQASQSNVFRRGSMEQGSLSSFLPQVPEDTQPFIHAPVNRQPTGRSSDGEAFGSTMMFVTQDGLASKSLPAPSLHVAPESAATSKLTSPSPPTAAASTSVSRVRGGSATDTSVGGQNVCEGRLPPGAAAEGSEEGSLKAGVGVRRALQQQQQQQQQGQQQPQQ
uniref:Uncharacterized protein n=2 Tax=Dunaliella tertiolecta TaxID=3047 RepID=A0A7S3QMS1_DUNTE